MTNFKKRTERDF